MTTIVMASPKGGCGKSTAAVILGTTFALEGAEVCFLDSDPNKSLTLWKDAGVERQGSLPSNIEVISNVKEATIVDIIMKKEEEKKIIIVDLEGVASLMVSRAISQADLVITPMQASALDAGIGSRVVNLIEAEEKVLRRKIKHSIVWAKRSSIISSEQKKLMKSVSEYGLHTLPSLYERQAFSSLFYYGGSLNDFPPEVKVGNLIKAKENAKKFTTAVYERLMDMEK